MTDLVRVFNGLEDVGQSENDSVDERQQSKNFPNFLRSMEAGRHAGEFEHCSNSNHTNNTGEEGYFRVLDVVKIFSFPIISFAGFIGQIDFGG